MKRSFIAALIGALILLTACSAATPTSSPDEDTLRVVVTHSILADLVRNVGGDTLDLHVLVDAGGDAHTYEPAPADLVTVAGADLIFENGLGFEGWLDGLVEASASGARRVVVTQNIEPLTFEAHHEEEEAHEEEEGHEDEHGELDPHVWHDVASAISMTEAIRDALIAADPDQGDTYRVNAEAYLAELEALDAWVRDQVAALPADRRKLVMSHDTFAYFARAYGFEIVGTALGASTGETEPSAGELAALITEIRAAGVPTIFAENVANPDLMAQIADEAGVRLAPPLYTDALGAPGTEGDTYINLIRYNVTTIVEALQSG